MNRTQLEQLADKVLLVVRSKPKSKFEIKSLAKRFKAEISDLNAALRIIHEWGYKLIQVQNRISFLSAPDVLSATEISFNLKTKLIGKVIHSFNTVKSTNDIAHQLAEKGAVEGTIITAEKQTLGKGRLGRSWHSPEKMGIYVSIILRPKFSPDKAPGLSIMSALAVAETLISNNIKNVQIKWPNDILINGRKVLGVLTELSAEKNRINYVIVGIGINVRQSENDFPPNIRALATSVKRETGQEILRVELFKQLLVNFEKEYALYKKSQLAKSLARIRKISSLLKQEVALKWNGAVVTGMALDIDPTGSLLIQSGENRLTISSGEVTVVKK
ncbi:MAG TPA: biotin--[acetyl-CoA-carboxylase] ligase [candidate division Zixibacteria bacterium]|nr:biotin--[acetyl-CoA-carboxylase] ligase [candidate division Zixibacteria bacterium]